MILGAVFPGRDFCITDSNERMKKFKESKVKDHLYDDFNNDCITMWF